MIAEIEIDTRDPRGRRTARGGIPWPPTLLELEAVDEGTLSRILVPEGTENVAVNTPIAILIGEHEIINDEEIEEVKKPDPCLPIKVLISYRRDDSKYQARIIHSVFCKALPRNNVFMDIDSMPPGANFRKIITAWVNECDIVLAVIGPRWLDAVDPRTNQRRLNSENDFVRIEIREALARDIRVVPVLIDGASMPDVNQLPEDLRELVDRHAEFVEYRTFEADVQRLINRLGLVGSE